MANFWNPMDSVSSSPSTSSGNELASTTDDAALLSVAHRIDVDALQFSSPFVSQSQQLSGPSSSGLLSFHNNGSSPYQPVGILSVPRVSPSATCRHIPPCQSVQQHVAKLDQYIFDLEASLRARDVELNALRPRFDGLVACYERMDTRLDILLAAHEQSEHQPSLPRTSTPQPAQLPARPRLNRADYPKIRYWKEAEWKAAEQKLNVPNVADGESTPKKVDKVWVWLQDMDGSVLTLSRLTALKLSMRRGWMTMLKKGNAPATWGKVTADALEKFRTYIYGLYPELELCEDDWKLEALCTAAYPGWHSTYAGAPLLVKKEAVADEVKPEPVPTSQARAAGSKRKEVSGEQQQLSKKARTANPPGSLPIGVHSSKPVHTEDTNSPLPTATEKTDSIDDDAASRAASDVSGIASCAPTASPIPSPSSDVAAADTVPTRDGAPGHTDKSTVAATALITATVMPPPQEATHASTAAPAAVHTEQPLPATMRTDPLAKFSVEAPLRTGLPEAHAQPASSKLAHLASVSQQVRSDPSKIPAQLPKGAGPSAKSARPIDRNAKAKRPRAGVVNYILLGKQEWCDKNPEGLEGEFFDYWEKLPESEIQKWQLASQEASQKKSKASKKATP